MTIISTESLARNLEEGAENWVIFDCRFNLANKSEGRNAYIENHLPGAQYIHLEDDLSSPATETSGRHPLPDPQQLAARLGAWGVDNDTQVIAYDGGPGAMAARLWWILRWLGHDNVAVLDGGYKKWMAEERAVTSEVTQNDARAFIPRVIENMVVTTDEIEESLESRALMIMDARDEKRFKGDEEPLDPVAGHIPGAVNMPFFHNLNDNGCLKEAGQLQEQYSVIIGNKAPEQVVQMCGSGVTACHNALALELAGITGTRLYVGSWSEWVSDRSRPVETGS